MAVQSTTLGLQYFSYITRILPKSLNIQAMLHSRHGSKPYLRHHCQTCAMLTDAEFLADLGFLRGACCPERCPSPVLHTEGSALWLSRYASAQSRIRQSNYGLVNVLNPNPGRVAPRQWPDCDTVQGDIINVFSSICDRSIAKAIRQKPDLHKGSRAGSDAADKTWQVLNFHTPAAATSIQGNASF